jgi:hypothetical protein
MQIEIDRGPSDRLADSGGRTSPNLDLYFLVKLDLAKQRWSQNLRYG